MLAQCLLKPLLHLPSIWPFFVKNAVLVRKFMPQPTTSSVVNLGPYAFPDVVLLKICPSSPWYANESGSQPGILLKATFGPEKPMPIMRLDECQFCYPVLRAFTNPSLPFDMTVVS
jgi:hypothetical protein